MDGQRPNAGTFPSAWTLLDTRIPVKNDAQDPAPAPSSTYPREWSLSTVPESMSDETETQSAESSAATFRGDFPIALSESKTPASTATTPSTFQTNWVLPANAGSERDNLYRSPYGEFANVSSPPGILHRKANGPYPDTATTVPDRPLDRMLDGQHPEMSPSGVPGNFKHQAYSNSQVSPASRPEPTSSGSANVVANGIIRRVVGHYNYPSQHSATSGATSASSVSNMSEMVAGQVKFGSQFSMASPLSPWGIDSSIYHPPRPAGFYQTTPLSAAQNNAVSAELYHPPRPAGFDPDSISPPTSLVSAQSQQSSPDPPYNHQSHPEYLPAIYERKELGRKFAPITIPDQASTLPGTVDSWLFSDADQLYTPPAAPLTATAPGRLEFY